MITDMKYALKNHFQSDIASEFHI